MACIQANMVREAGLFFQLRNVSFFRNILRAVNVDESSRSLFISIIFINAFTWTFFIEVHG